MRGVVWVFLASLASFEFAKGEDTIRFWSVTLPQDNAVPSSRRRLLQQQNQATLDAVSLSDYCDQARDIGKFKRGDNSLGREIENLNCLQDVDEDGNARITFVPEEAIQLQNALEALEESAVFFANGTLATISNSLEANLKAYARRKELSEALRTQVTTLARLAVTSYHTQALRLRRLKAVPLIDANFAARRRLLASQWTRDAILLQLMSAATGTKVPSSERPLASLRALAVGRRRSQCFVDTSFGSAVRTVVDPASNLPIGVANTTFVIEDLTFVSYLTPLSSVQLSGQAVADASELSEIMLTGQRCILTLQGPEVSLLDERGVALLYLADPSRSVCTSFDPDAETVYEDTFVVVPDVPDETRDNPGDIAVAKALRRDVEWRESAVRTSLPVPGLSPRPLAICRRSAAEDLAVSNPSNAPEPDLTEDNDFIRFVAASLVCPTEPRPVPAVAAAIPLLRVEDPSVNATFDWADASQQLGRCLPVFVGPSLGDPSDWDLTSSWESSYVRVDVWSALATDRIVWVVRGHSGAREATAPVPAAGSEQVACVRGFEIQSVGCNWVKGPLPASVLSGWSTAEHEQWCSEDLETSDPWVIQAARLLATAAEAECTVNAVFPAELAQTETESGARPAHLFPVSASKLVSLGPAYRGFSEWQSFGRDLLNQAFQDPLPTYPDAQNLLGKIRPDTAYGLPLRLSWNGNEATVIGVNATSPFYQRVLPRYASSLVVGWEQQEGELFYDLSALRLDPDACWHDDGDQNQAGGTYRVFGRVQGVFVESYVQLEDDPATLCAWEAPMSGQSWDLPRAEAIKFAREGLFSERVDEASVAEAALQQALDASRVQWDAESAEVSGSLDAFGEALAEARILADEKLAKYDESTNATQRYLDGLRSVLDNVDRAKVRVIPLLPTDCSTVSSLWGEDAGSCVGDLVLLAFLTYVVVGSVIVIVYAVGSALA